MANKLGTGAVIVKGDVTVMVRVDVDNSTSELEGV